MKRIILSLVAVLAACTMFTANAQNPQRPANGQKLTPEMRAERQAVVVADQLCLDDETAPKFIEVYKQYKLESMAIDKEFRTGHKHSGMTEAETDAQIRKGFEKSQKNLDLKIAYYDKFLKVINAKQIQKMYAIEKKVGSKSATGMHKSQPAGRPVQPKSQPVNR